MTTMKDWVRSMRSRCADGDNPIPQRIVGNRGRVGAAIRGSGRPRPVSSQRGRHGGGAVLVALIVAIAVLGDRRSGFLATASATLWFDFFLTRPYEKFAITQHADIEIAVSLFVVGLIVTELAARNRHHFAVATEESNYVGLIYRISELRGVEFFHR